MFKRPKPKALDLAGAEEIGIQALAFLAADDDRLAKFLGLTGIAPGDLVAGARTPRGHAYGKTNADGTAVEDGKVDHGQLFHTYLETVGVDSTQNCDIAGQQIPIADPSVSAVSELLT